MQKSGRNNACPSCGRTKDADCRWSDDVIFCHQGSNHGPDQSLRVGDTILIDGAPWALVKRNGGYDGNAFVFKPHQEKADTSHRTVNRQELLTKQAKRSIASVSLERFFTAYQRAWDINDLHSLTPQAIDQAITTIEHAAGIGRDLSGNVDQIWREHQDLRDLYKLRFEACLLSINYQVADLAHFRTHYLGQSSAEVMF